jgi:hypothetical protein
MDEFFGREYLLTSNKYMKLDLSIPHEQMYIEAKNLRDLYIPYYPTSFNKWYCLPIKGIDADNPFHWQGGPNKGKYKSANDFASHVKWTKISEMCPITTEWLKTVYPSNSLGRVRFMLLEAGGSLGYHTDNDVNLFGNINIALNNPIGCKWLWLDGESLEFNPGDIYTINTSYKHSVVNESEEDRYHIIIHHNDSTDEYKKLMITSMEKYNVQGYFHYSTELF